MKEGVRLEDLGVDGVIILNQILKKEDGKAQTRFVYIRIYCCVHSNEQQGPTNGEEFFYLLRNC